MRDHKQISELDPARAQQAQASTPAAAAESDSVELSVEKLEERIAPVTRLRKF